MYGKYVTIEHPGYKEEVFVADNLQKQFKDQLELMIAFKKPTKAFICAIRKHFN